MIISILIIKIIKKIKKMEALISKNKQNKFQQLKNIKNKLFKKELIIFQKILIFQIFNNKNIQIASQINIKL